MNFVVDEQRLKALASFCLLKKCPSLGSGTVLSKPDRELVLRAAESLAGRLPTMPLSYLPVAQAVAQLAWFVAEAWRFDTYRLQSVLTAMKASEDAPTWSPEAERETLLSKSSGEHIFFLWSQSLSPKCQFEGALCQTREVRKDSAPSSACSESDLSILAWNSKTGQCCLVFVQDDDVKKELSFKTVHVGFSSCDSLSVVPGSNFLVGIEAKKKRFLVGEFGKPPCLAVECPLSKQILIQAAEDKTLVLQTEVLPCGKILCTVSVRNEITGGSLYAANVCFTSTLEPSSVEESEAREALERVNTFAANPEAWDSERDTSTVTVQAKSLTESVVYDSVTNRVLFHVGNSGTAIAVAGSRCGTLIVFASGLAKFLREGTSEKTFDIGFALHSGVAVNKRIFSQN